MIKICKMGILLEKTTIEFESKAVLNPGVIQDANQVHLFYRAIDKNNVSSIGYCYLDGPDTIIFRNKKPLLSPEYSYEKCGLEDPRISKIDQDYYLTYTAFDGVTAAGAVAISKDLIHFKKMGIITPMITFTNFEKLTKLSKLVSRRYWNHFNSNPFFKEINRSNFLWDKNILFFPRRINGYICFLHRIKPDIQLVLIKELDELTKEFWEEYFPHLNHFTILMPKFNHEHSYLGGGAPPIETALGWILIYHGVKHTPSGNIYTICAALLDINNPLIELSRLPYPLIEPEYPWERKGEVNNVCFPCGTALFGDQLYIYYGAADERIAYAKLTLAELITELQQYQTTTLDSID